MREKIDTLLLFAIAACLVALILKPESQIGRFQPYPQSTAGVLLDTQTGQTCAPYPGGFEGITLCSELAK